MDVHRQGQANAAGRLDPVTVGPAAVGLEARAHGRGVGEVAVPVQGIAAGMDADLQRYLRAIRGDAHTPGQARTERAGQALAQPQVDLTMQVTALAMQLLQ